MTPEEKKRVKILLKILAKLKKPELSALISNLDDNGINHICQLFYNVLYNNVKLKNKAKESSLKKLMKRNKANIHFISKFTPNKKIVAEKRKILQSGGFPLAAILGMVIPTVLSLLKK